MPETDIVQLILEQGATFALAALAMWMLREIYRERVRDLKEENRSLRDLVASVREELARTRKALENNTSAMNTFARHMDDLLKVAERMERKYDK